MEGLWWPTLVRRSLYDTKWVTDFINNELVIMTEGDEGEQVRSDEWDSNRWYAYYYTINKNTLQAAFSSDSPRQSDGAKLILRWRKEITYIRIPLMIMYGHFLIRKWKVPVTRY